MSVWKPEIWGGAAAAAPRVECIYRAPAPTRGGQLLLGEHVQPRGNALLRTWGIKKQKQNAQFEAFEYSSTTFVFWSAFEPRARAHSLPWVPHGLLHEAKARVSCWRSARALPEMRGRWGWPQAICAPPLLPSSPLSPSPAAARRGAQAAPSGTPQQLRQRVRVGRVGVCVEERVRRTALRPRTAAAACRATAAPSQESGGRVRIPSLAVSLLDGAHSRLQ